MNISANSLSFGSKNLYIFNNIEKVNEARRTFEQRAINGMNMEIIPTERENELLVIDNDDADCFRRNIYDNPQNNKKTAELYYNTLVSIYRNSAEKHYL